MHELLTAPQDEEYENLSESSKAQGISHIHPDLLLEVTGVEAMLPFGVRYLEPIPFIVSKEGDPPPTPTTPSTLTGTTYTHPNGREVGDMPPDPENS